MKPLHLPLLCALLLCTVVAREQRVMSDSRLTETLDLLSLRKLPHLVRALDGNMALYPDDPRLPALRAEIVKKIAEEMPPRKFEASIGAIVSTPRPPLPLARRPSLGGDFVTEDPVVAMIWIPPGTFMLSPPQSSDDNTRVTFTRGYWLGQTEVTQEQWQALMEEDPRPSHFKGSDRPVEWVAWGKAMEFCRRLGLRERAAGRVPEGYDYTLPTEAQWEYACRAGTTGNHAGDLDALGWYERNSGRQTHPVGRKLPNAWGLYDMHGNVIEWCLDLYRNYPGGHLIDPLPDRTAPTGSVQPVTRGGGWLASAGQTRSAYRAWRPVGHTSPHVGFRVALTPQLPSPTPPAAAGRELHSDR